MRACYVCGTYEPIAKLMVPHEDLCENEDLIRQFVEKGWAVMPWVCSNGDDHTKPQCEDKSACMRRDLMRM